MSPVFSSVSVALSFLLSIVRPTYFCTKFVIFIRIVDLNETAWHPVSRPYTMIDSWSTVMVPCFKDLTWRIQWNVPDTIYLQIKTKTGSISSIRYLNLAANTKWLKLWFASIMKRVRILTRSSNFYLSLWPLPCFVRMSDRCSLKAK